MPRLRVIDDEVIERPFDKRQFLRLLQFLKPYRKPIAFSLFLMVTNAVCSLGAAHAHVPRHRRDRRGQRLVLPAVPDRHGRLRGGGIAVRALPRPDHGYRGPQRHRGHARGPLQPHPGPLLQLLRLPQRGQDHGPRHQRHQLAQRPVHKRYRQRLHRLRDADPAARAHVRGQLEADADLHVPAAVPAADPLRPQAQDAPELAGRAQQDLQHERLPAREPLRHARDRGLYPRG